jgi:hypothetical protein
LIWVISGYSSLDYSDPLQIGSEQLARIRHPSNLEEQNLDKKSWPPGQRESVCANSDLDARRKLFEDFLITAKLRPEDHGKGNVPNARIHILLIPLKHGGKGSRNLLAVSVLC